MRTRSPASRSDRRPRAVRERCRRGPQRSPRQVPYPAAASGGKHPRGKFRYPGATGSGPKWRGGNPPAAGRDGLRDTKLAGSYSGCLLQMGAMVRIKPAHRPIPGRKIGFGQVWIFIHPPAWATEVSTAASGHIQTTRQCRDNFPYLILDIERGGRRGM